MRFARGIKALRIRNESAQPLSNTQVSHCTTILTRESSAFSLFHEVNQKSFHKEIRLTSRIPKTSCIPRPYSATQPFKAFFFISTISSFLCIYIQELILGSITTRAHTFELAFVSPCKMWKVSRSICSGIADSEFKTRASHSIAF